MKATRSFITKICRVIGMPYKYAKKVISGEMKPRQYGQNTVHIVFRQRRDKLTVSFAKSVSDAITDKRNNNLPVARYDEKSNRAYLEYADGRKEYIEET